MNSPLLLPILRGIALVLGLVVVIELVVPYDVSEPAASLPGHKGKDGGAAGQRVGDGLTPEAVNEMLTRPLFEQSRRGVIKNTQDHVGPAPVTDLPRLSGLMIAGDTRFAIFQPTGQDARPVVVAIGGEIAGYNIVSIAPDGVVVDGPEGQQTLLPTLDPNAVPAEPAMPPARSPRPIPRPAAVPGQPGTPVQPIRPGLPGVPMPVPPRGLNPRGFPNGAAPNFQPGGTQPPGQPQMPRPVFPSASNRGDD